jgi:mono/diheme cytochrome c family protein
MKAILKVVSVSALLFAWPSALVLADLALIGKGEKIYAEKKCVPCHLIKGKGGTAGPAARGPDLSNVGTKRDGQWFKTFLKDPKAVNPKSKMMAFKGSDEELEAVVAYLASLK